MNDAVARAYRQLGWASVALLVVAGLVFGAAALVARTDAQKREWDAWCVAEGGQVVGWTQVPPDQHGSVIRSRYCLVDHRVIGAR